MILRCGAAAEVKPAAGLFPDRQGVVRAGESKGLARGGRRENHLLDVNEVFVYA